MEARDAERQNTPETLADSLRGGYRCSQALLYGENERGVQEKKNQVKVLTLD